MRSVLSAVALAKEGFIAARSGSLLFIVKQVSPREMLFSNLNLSFRCCQASEPFDSSAGFPLSQTISTGHPIFPAGILPF
jgi:hypothetical protein